MNSADMVNLVPDPDDLLTVSVPEQGRLILRLMTLVDNQTNELTGPTKSGRFSYHNFFNRGNDFAAPPKYGDKQPLVDEALMEAWAWLAGQGHLARDPGPGPDWYFVTKGGRAFITSAAAHPTSGSPEVQSRPSAGYEGHIITAEMVTEKGRGKFIPILRQGNWDTAIPTALTGIFGVDLRSDSPTEYQKLVNHLKGMTPTGTRSSAASAPHSVVADPRTTTPHGPAQTEDGRYFRERRDLPETELVQRIWQRPHWRILVQPHEYLPGHFRAPADCEVFVKSDYVTAFGNESLPIIAPGTSFYTSASPACARGETDYAEFPALCEAWTLFQSAQFVLSRPLSH